MDWKSRIRAACIVDGQALDDGVLEELSQHAAGVYEAARADGCSHDEAEQGVEALLADWRRHAPALRRRLQRPTVIEPSTGSVNLLAGIVQDARHGFRLLRREPVFSIVAILTIALGIGAATTLYSIVNSVLSRRQRSLGRWSAWWTTCGRAGVADARQPEIFLPHRQIRCAAAVPDPILVVRTTDNPSRHVPTLRSVVRDEAPTLALDSVMTMEERVMTNLAKPRLYAVVLAGFGAFAVAIAGVGLFGVLAYSVAQRVREIGVRTALGARPADIVRLVLRQTALIAVGATTIGLWLAFAAATSLSRFLYGVGPHDAVTFVAVGAVVVAVSAIACIVPARRAARVDPLRALRSL